MTDEKDPDPFEALAEVAISIAASLERIATTLEEQTALVRRQTVLTESAHQIAVRSEQAREELVKLSKKNLDLQEDMQRQINEAKPPKEPWQEDDTEEPS